MSAVDGGRQARRLRPSSKLFNGVVWEEDHRTYLVLTLIFGADSFFLGCCFAFFFACEVVLDLDWSETLAFRMLLQEVRCEDLWTGSPSPPLLAGHRCHGGSSVGDR